MILLVMKCFLVVAGAGIALALALAAVDGWPE